MCQHETPTHAKLPPVPDFPFQMVVGDHFTLAGKNYLVLVDRFSGWPVLEFCGATVGNSTGLIKTLRNYFAVYGVPEELATDGSTVFTSGPVQEFLKRFQINHRVSSPHNPHSNQRAELGVRSMKRLCRENVGSDGSLDNDKVLRAILGYRNTPDQDTGRSPSCVLFGRQLREFLPVPLAKLKPCDSWRLLREDREKALAKRALRCTEKLASGARSLPDLLIGDTVRLQNLVGSYPTRWDTTGVVVEIHDFDKYVICIHGSGRLITRNRRYLRKIIQYAQPMKQDLTIVNENMRKQSVDDIVRAEARVRTDSYDHVGARHDAPAPSLLMEPESVTTHRLDPRDVAEGSNREPGNVSTQEGGAGLLRRSGRLKCQPDRLVLDPKAKSYNASSFSHQMFPST